MLLTHWHFSQFHSCRVYVPYYNNNAMGISASFSSTYQTVTDNVCLLITLLLIMNEAFVLQYTKFFTLIITRITGIPTLLVIVNSWKRCSVGLLVLLNETTDQQHRCLLLFLNLAGKASLIVGETVAYHSCTTVFTVWLVFPPHLFVVLPSPLVQLMATHFVSCPVEPTLTSTPIHVPLLTGMPSRHLWSLVLPFIRSAVRYIAAWPTNHTPILAVTGGNPWSAITKEPKNTR